MCVPNLFNTEQNHRMSEENDDDDNIERQNAEISLLQAMYPTELTWTSDKLDEVLHHFKQANRHSRL